MLIIAQLNNLLAPTEQKPLGKGFAPDVYPLIVEGDGKPRLLLQDYYAESLRRDAATLEYLAVLWQAGEITENEFLTMATLL